MEALTSTLTNITTVFTSALGWAGTIGETIMDTPILLIFVSIPLLGIGINLFRRMLSMD